MSTQLDAEAQRKAGQPPENTAGESGENPTEPARRQDYHGKVLALDVGGARIGVAVCDPLGLAARPVVTLRRGNHRQDQEAIATLVRSEEVTAILCGLPLNMDGSEGAQAVRTRKWAVKLAHALRDLLDNQPIPVIFWDERMSTFTAGDILEGEILAGNAKSQFVRAGEDAIAAAVILQSWLDAQRAGDTRDFGRVEIAPRRR